MNYVVYSDASYCDKDDIGACGFVVVSIGRMIKHEVHIVSGLKKPTNAEIHALVAGIQYCFLLNGVKNIRAYTDCQSIVRRKTRRKQYQELNETLDIILDHKIGVVINFVRSHSGNYYNNFIDKSCRAQLRKYLKKHR